MKSNQSKTLNEFIKGFPKWEVLKAYPTTYHHCDETKKRKSKQTATVPSLDVFVYEEGLRNTFISNVKPIWALPH